MRFKAIKTSVSAKSFVAPSDEQLIDALIQLDQARTDLYEAGIELEKISTVYENCMEAAAAVEVFGLSKEVLAIYNRDGNMFTDIGMEFDVAAMEAMEDEQKTEKKEETTSKLKAAAGANLDVMKKAIKAVWEKIINFIRKWFMTNNMLAGSIEKNVANINVDFVNSDDFKKQEATCYKADEINAIYKALPDFSKLLNNIRLRLPEDIKKMMDGEKGNGAIEDAFAKNFAQDGKNLEAVGVMFNENGMVLNKTKFKAEKRTYGDAGFTADFLKNAGKIAVEVLRNDKQAMSEISKAIDQEYKNASAEKDAEKAQTAHKCLGIVNQLIGYKASLTGACCAQIDLAIRKAKGKPAKAEEPAANDDKKPEEEQK